MKISTLSPVRSYASGLVTAINRVLVQLLAYNDLWKNDKQKYIQRFALRSRNPADYDETMAAFLKISQTLDRSPNEKPIYSVELSLKQFYQGLRYHCQEWIAHYGQQLYSRVSQKLKTTNERIAALMHGLRHDADTVPDLKFVLNIIAQINQEHELLEHDIHQIEQSYRVLDQYHIDYPPTDRTLTQTLSLNLTDLLEQSRVVKHRLKPIRERFREIIQYDVDLFQRIVDEFVEKFDHHGPQTLENDLNRMFLSVRQYQQEMSQIEQRKLDLINAMKLFHITLINYPELVRVNRQIEQLDVLSNLYDEFKRQETIWSKILWNELDVNDLMSNVDSFVKRFRHLPAEMKTNTVGQAMETHFTSNE